MFIPTYCTCELGFARGLGVSHSGRADGTPVVMGKKKGFLKLMTCDNPEMVVVLCFIKT